MSYRSRTDYKIVPIQSMHCTKKNKYVCVHCGLPVNELYKQYSPSVLKLVHCNNCQNVADKYVEYDTVILIIDIILFSRQAYRHLLFNSDFQNLWKLALMLLLIKSFDEWMFLNVVDVSKELSSGSEILSEQTFYISCLITVTGKFLFTIIVLSLLLIKIKISEKDLPAHHYVKMLWRALVTSSFGHFLLLPSLIWSDFHREIHLIFITAYIMLSQIQALSVVCFVKLPSLVAILLTALVADYGISTYLRSILWIFLKQDT